MAKGHIQDVNKSDVLESDMHIHARSGVLFEISALRIEEKVLSEENGLLETCEHSYNWNAKRAKQSNTRSSFKAPAAC
jgi:hypothetical protein